jgi:hemerythrin-like domain-containing protein
MNSIELMVEEHKNIVRMLKVLRKACYNVLQGEDIIYEDFEQMVDFIRVYADSHHHGKEEKFLFKEMIDKLGKVGTNLITHGMLVEHDYGRLFVSELLAALGRVKAGDEESKLDVISNGVGYANHLARHIEKEDKVVYTYADKNLSKETLNYVNELTLAFEEIAHDKGTQKHYLESLNKLEKKYIGLL